MLSIWLSSGEREFVRELEKNEMFDKILTYEQIQAVFPNLKKNMLSFYLTALVRKQWMFKIKNKLYILPSVIIERKKITKATLIKYLDMNDLKIYVDWDNDIVWLGADKKDSKKIKEFKKLYKIMGNWEGYDFDLLDDEFFFKFKKIKIIYKQDLTIRPRQKAWTNLFDEEARKRSAKLQGEKEKK